ncbi:MAG: hypothetical protein IKK22_00935 [Firmicutes bacterium]|nr:hypothetical protein [Bacillota bacterium]MBR4073962.1 hypothetical protein [Bacillota bacterium]MBR7147284.1 hypothetical protein [Bacillota bacterium]
MKQKIARFMYGRYGVDQLSRSMMVLVIVLVVLGIFFKTRLIDWASTILLILVYFRMFSRNINKRYQENMKYMVVHNKMMAKYNGWKEAFACRKTHKVFACPGCGQKVRVPRGKGKVKVHCPKCNTSFIKNS